MFAPLSTAASLPVGRFSAWRALAGVTQLIHRKDPSA